MRVSREEAEPLIQLADVGKRFTLHNQGGAVIEVMRGAALAVAPGECVALVGRSGAGKSTLMRLIYGNYLAQAGSIVVKGLDVVRAAPREILQLRRETLGYVTQFLRVVPRVPTLHVVAEPLLALGMQEPEARARAAELLARLNVPERLWSLSPTTFSGGEQQRVNIARGFAHAYPALLLDEPTASLDPENRAVVLDLITEAKRRGAAILGIFHDATVRAAVSDREVDVTRFAPEAVPPAGRVFAVVGASGVGKDTLIDAAIAASPGLLRMRRVITRPEAAGGEAFDSVSRAEFARRRDAGEFVLHWEAHGLCYGVPATIRQLLAVGHDVIFNGSRAMLGQAAAAFPTLVILHVTASPEIRAARLAARARESDEGITARLGRASSIFPPGVPTHEIENDGQLGRALAAFLAAIDR